MSPATGYRNAWTISSPRLNVPRSSPAKERIPCDAPAFESSGEDRRIRTTVFFPAIPRYSAVTSSGKRPAAGEAVGIPAGHCPQLVKSLARIAGRLFDPGEVPEHQVAALGIGRLARGASGEKVRGLPEDPGVLHRRAPDHDAVAAGLGE